MAEKDALIEDRHTPGDEGDTITGGDDEPAVVHIAKKRTKTALCDLTRFRVTGHHAE